MCCFSIAVVHSMYGYGFLNQDIFSISVMHASGLLLASHIGGKCS